MTSTEPVSHRMAFALLCFLILLSSLHSRLGSARDFAAVGAQGDFAARDACPAGQFLVGMRVRSGAWMDQISITCAPVAPNGDVGAPWFGTTRGGNGGGPSERTCGAGKIVGGIGLLFTDGNRQVLTIDVSCRSTTGNDRTTFRLGQEPPGFSRFPTEIQTCPAGEAATGVQGRYGRHVNALGLLCGAFTPGGGSGAGGGGGPGPSAGTGCAGLSGEELDICNEHNAMRARHGVPALNWSPELASNAQQWVSACRKAKNSNNDEFFCHQSPSFGCGTDPNYHYGENLSFGYPSRTGKEAAQQWYCESKVYDFNNPSPKLAGEDDSGTIFGDACDPANNPKKVTGHFTQMIWKATTRLGCARNTCALGTTQGTLWACEYDPPGNFNAAQPGVLSQNVPRALQGFAPMMIGERSAARPITTVIISDVDLYDVPGGVGRVIGMLRQGQTLPLYECKADDWCRVAGGWVWGAFLVRSHVH
ncbi:CAP domain-containing protein [Cupriavidus plantarum]|uniref:CAP domain-containing protein n=1 Tax=Cupriavidus plantarum TaxID=942865 RepID=UPI0015C9D791|nr:CAP domain-containing protein [Cupriavidus plantarum]NYH99947.1 uncharacterized protein YkwD [Cupriavidus plantarum]